MGRDPRFSKDPLRSMTWEPPALHSSPTYKNNMIFFQKSPGTEEVTAQYTIAREKLSLLKIVWKKTPTHCTLLLLEIFASSFYDSRISVPLRH